MTNNIRKIQEKTKFKGDDYYYDIIRKNIRKYRRMADYTQAELAEILDVTTQYLCRIETRKPKIQYSVGLLGKIADALDVDIKELFVEQKKK